MSVVHKNKQLPIFLFKLYALSVRTIEASYLLIIRVLYVQTFKLVYNFSRILYPRNYQSC